MLAVSEVSNREVMALLNKAITSKIINPMFRLDERPDVIEVLYKDAMNSYINEARIDLYAPRSDDYLDDTKPITSEVERSYNIKATSIMRDLEERAREQERMRQ